MRAGVSLYDSTTGKTFGPVFDTIYGADDFIAWFNDLEQPLHEDLRLYTEDELQDLVNEWYADYSGEGTSGSST